MIRGRAAYVGSVRKPTKDEPMNDDHLDTATIEARARAMRAVFVRETIARLRARADESGETGGTSADA